MKWQGYKMFCLDCNGGVWNEVRWEKDKVTKTFVLAVSKVCLMGGAAGQEKTGGLQNKQNFALKAATKMNYSS